MLLALSFPFVASAQSLLDAPSLQLNEEYTETQYPGDTFLDVNLEDPTASPDLNIIEDNTPIPGTVKYLFDPDAYSTAFEQENLDYISNLPNESKETIISDFIQIILGMGAILAAASVIGAAVYYMISMGNEDDTGKAKNILLYSIIGLLIMSGAYGIIVGIAKLQFF